MNIVREIQSDLNAAALLADWLGDEGRPVDQMTAEFRAQRCIGCECNVQPNWWDRVKHVIADWIRGELEVKEQMQLRVAVEDELAMCKKCGCCLRLAVWVPKAHYRRHTDPASLLGYPDRCWKKKELSAPK